MKLINLLTLFFLILTSFSAKSQVLDTEFQKLYDDFEYLKKFDNAMTWEYDGSPYLHDNFIPGTLILSNQKTYNNILLRYNVYYDLFEFIKDDVELALEKSRLFQFFQIGESTFQYSSYIYAGEIVEGYLEVVVEGEYSLYLKHSVKLRDGIPSGVYQDAKKPTFFPQKPKILIGNSESVITEVKNAKDFFKTFKNMEDTIEDYTGGRKLKLNSLQDYIELVNFLNSI